jgi:tRNA(Ile)-lysidine synthase
MQEKVQTYILKHQLLELGKPVIVGMSGGPDSVALLHILLSLGYECIVAHCNFHLRSNESDRDELFVRNQVKALKIQGYFIDFETTEYAEKHKISIEMAARDLRYNWFYNLLEKLDAQAIAVAHHADDSIETMLMNLVRGTGLKGLTGISPRNNKVVRPLLCASRLEIETYLIEKNLSFIEDSSNSSLEYQRNRFRHQVLPLLEEINPSVRQTLYHALQHFEGNLAVYQQAIEKIENEIVVHEFGSIKIDIELLKKQIHISTILFELLYPFGFGNALIEQIIEQLDGESGRLFYSDTHRLLKDRKYLIIHKISSFSKDIFRITEHETLLEQPIHLKISKKKKTADFILLKNLKHIQVDASKINFPLLLRKWEAGDSFYPFGMNRQKKLSDYFIDNKFSMFEKEQTWLLVSGNDIVWIVGKRLDNRFRITEDTIDILEFEIE